MKNLKLTLIVAMLAVVTVASAQMRLGVKGGVNASNFYGSELNDNNAKIGFNIGLSADYDFAYNMGIQTGLFYTTKGFKFKQSISEFTSNLVYLQIPVHLAYKIDVTPGTRVFLHGGPYLAYGVGGSNSFKLGRDEISPSKVFGDNGLKSFDAGLGIGAGIELGQLFFDLGWDAGLLDIVKSDSFVKNFISKDVSLKNQSAYLSVGFKF